MTNIGVGLPRTMTQRPVRDTHRQGGNNREGFSGKQERNVVEKYTLSTGFFSTVSTHRHSITLFLDVWVTLEIRELSAGRSVRGVQKSVRHRHGDEKSVLRTTRRRRQIWTRHESRRINKSNFFFCFRHSDVCVVAEYGLDPRIDQTVGRDRLAGRGHYDRIPMWSRRQTHIFLKTASWIELYRGTMYDAIFFLLLLLKFRSRVSHNIISDKYTVRVEEI